MGMLAWPRTGDLVRDLESYMRKERELGVWGFPHFVRYLRAIIIRLTPQPHRCTEAVLDAATVVLAANTGALLNRLMTTPPGGQHPRRSAHSESRAHLSRCAANAICEVIGCWAGHDPQPGLAAGVKFHNNADGQATSHAYERAKSIVRAIESDAIDIGLTMDELMECAVDAFADNDSIDQNRRDAAIAAMSAGHFNLSHEILTDAPREKN